MKHIRTFENNENYGTFDKENIGDIVTCYQLPSYGYHNLKKGKQYEIVDARHEDGISEIKVKPVEDELNRYDRYDRYYLDIYFLPEDVKKKRRELKRAAKKYNI